ncbi:MAG: amino acid adenylation domain-containing protein [Verrucomicrobiae bacterium]|nr:amino acid adenylation domain-containing protein [Verrucomicrobiae bacterium]
MTERTIISSLSTLQDSMLRRSLDRADGSTVEQVEIVFARDVAVERITTAWGETVARCEVLRAGFHFENGEPAGIVRLDQTPQAGILGEAPDCWDAWLADDRLAPLPLVGGCPWRVVVCPAARRMVWTFHHALLDGRSIARIVAFFQSQLEDPSAGGSLGHAAAPPVSAEETEDAIRFHRQAFAEVASCQPEFPGDATGDPARGGRVLGAEAVAALESAARRMDATTATLVTWAWGQAVATAAGAARTAVGQVRAGAPTDGCAGFTMNTVPLVIERAPDESAGSVLAAFRRHLLAMRAIERVAVDELPPAIFREAGGPWPGGVLMVQHGTLERMAGRVTSVERITLHERSGENLLASAWIEPELKLEVEVDGRVFGPLAARHLADHWAEIILALARGDDTSAAQVAALPSNKWEAPAPECRQQHLAAAWKESVARYCDQTALWTPDVSLTYSELDARVEHLASILATNCVAAGDTVAGMLHQREHVALVQLAAARVDAILVPLDPALPKSRLETIVADARPNLLLTDRPDEGGALGLLVIAVDGATGGTCASAVPDDPRATLSILYTSGSTGIPKGVMMVHGGVVNEGAAMGRLAGISPGDRLLQFASPGFDASLEEITAALLAGGTLVPRPDDLASDLDVFHEFIHSARISVIDLSTAHWAAWCAWMASEGKTIPPSVRTTIIGGERASAAAVATWFQAGGRDHVLINTYGPTEASVVATAECITAGWNEPGDPAIGRPLPGVHARVADREGRRLPYGAAGELWLGGSCVGRGYWQRPELTAEAFRRFDGMEWYRTGDRVHWDEAGKLRFLGRQDDQLKIRGNRVEPNEVIRVLEGFPGVVAAHAGPVRGIDGSMVLGAWVRWNDTPEDGWPGLLAAHAAGQLPAASVPSRWAAVSEFLLTERGKLDRANLPEPALTASSGKCSEPPATSTERRLAEIWSELLGVPSIGRDDSFFELGGHSLMALQLFARIAREWRTRIPMAVLMQAPTPRTLGEIIDRMVSSPGSAGTARPLVVPVRAEGSLPPLFCIHGGDGGVLFYREFARGLSGDRPVLAIEAPALSAEGSVATSPVGETAGAYLEVLREHQPRGPYHLLGYSYGGLVVVEIARRLIAAGESVAFAGLCDTVNPATPIREYSLMERIEVFWDAQESPSPAGRIFRMLSRMTEGLATHLRVKNEVRNARTARRTEPYSEERMVQVRESHLQSMRDYQPAPLDLPITLFKSSVVDDKFEIPSDYGWGIVSPAVEVVEVPGKHLTMFDDPHVGTLAAETEARM